MARIIPSKSKRRPFTKKYDKKELDKKNTKALLALAKKNQFGVGPIVGRHSLKKDDLVKALLARQRGVRSKCPEKKYACKRTGPLETPVRTDKGGCRYCTLHPKRKIAQRKLPCSKRKPRTSCKGKGLAARDQPKLMQYRTGDKKMYCSKCRKSKR